MVDWEQKRSEATDLAVRAGFSQADAAALADAARPALRLLAVPGVPAASATSKLGGLPDLPPEVAWPVGEFGPMTFCGQVRTRDASDLPAVDAWQAGDSLLAFFADKDPETDEVDGGCVLTVARDDTVRREPPPGLSPGSSLLDESRFETRSVLTPSMQHDGMVDAELDHDFDEDDWAAWNRLYTALGCGATTITDGHHQLLGHAWDVGMAGAVWMGAIRLLTPEEHTAGDDEARRFRLLAQFTTDQEANVEFADGGAVYFVVSAEDLAAANFERVAVFMESC